MPPLDKSRQYGQAVLDHVQTGAYPEFEDVVSAELPAAALPDVSQLIERARNKLEDEIRVRSREIAPDVDGWISSAKQLQADIHSSQSEAHEIIEEGNHGKKLQNSVVDAASKVRLLEDELAFNQNLETSLQRLQSMREQLDNIQQDILENRLLSACDGVQDINGPIASSSNASASRVAAAFSSRVAELRSDIAERLVKCWNHYIHVDKEASMITIKNEATGTIPIEFETVVQAMRKLGLIDQAMFPFCRDIERLLILPRLQVQRDGTVQLMSVDNSTISSTERSSDLSADSLFSDLVLLIDFLREKLPPSLIDPLSGQLMPYLLSRLISIWLMSAVPEDLKGMESFRSTSRMVQDFADRLESYHWPGKSDLDGWLASVPDVWTRKRQEDVLRQVRKLVVKGGTSTEVVERVETQILSKHDDVFASNDPVNDWNADWSDEDESPSSKPAQTKPIGNDAIPDEEDVSAWGFDDGKQNTDTAHQQGSHNTQEASEDAWGWGDDDQSSPVATKSPGKGNAIDQKANGVEKNSRAPDQQQVTLRETYTVTSLPKEILDIISRVSSDWNALQSPVYHSTSLAKCASTLSSLPALALALFRASSPSAYNAHSSGNMLLYNDCLWLAEQLQSPDTVNESGQGSLLPNCVLKADSSALENHGKRAYSKEMDLQRTVITDLLDGAQGFMQCTEHPFIQECDVAVASTIDRLRQLHREWKDVLSHSALLQAMGSLLSTICSKMILDIEDMSDISEPESQQLARYCERIASLEDIFTPQVPDGSSPNAGDIVPLTAAYVTSWLKFRYLANILESSLADIKYLWTEEGLSLEFETEEVIDLVVALFAEGPHRRGAITEIRAAQRSR